MSVKLSDQVVDRSRRCIDLRDQRGGLTAPVIESLRNFLRHNDLYIHLCVSDNLLSNEALSELCGLLKRHPYLTSLEAQHCGLQDKDFCFYFGLALISMPRLTFVDLSRNSGLTDASAETVARILRETEVESIRLVGTSFSATGGRVIAAAAANTTSLMNCELPYTVGNVVLEAVAACTRRNREHRDRVNEASTQYARWQGRHCRLPSLPGLKRVETGHTGAAVPAGPLERSTTLSVASAPAAKSGAGIRGVPHPWQRTQGLTSEDRQWQACVTKGRRRSLLHSDSIIAASAAVTTSAPPSITGSSARDYPRSTPLSNASTTVLSAPVITSASRGVTPSPLLPPPPPHSFTQRVKPTPDSLDTVTMWDWADPAMSNALRCLFVLDHQAQVLDHYRAASEAPVVAGPEAARRAKTRSKGRERSSVHRGRSSGRTGDAAGLPPLWTP
ncbi:hypothetical protein ABB37_02998 [Leptomonas pyrrhocoris]|uniref:Uncharacterized protein n=1 Tax=Leptomonas pyrrhocoris TaxID=157538 RepID=A0A0N0DXT2_LEPPY|nr:hypothetical protein ABB37_02998 [Leptomonas pyrrhocoris]KPA83345.1 hypothetical protein ABB37_02998 [Leptomonas pyrrhocoris]|eukprot:XP_015661784.1 hypothetical protein ABB37_02998 [Leptomonas pyrrhocoris]